MKFVMTQAVCPEGMQLLDGIADVYVADNQDPNNYLDEMWYQSMYRSQIRPGT